MKNIALFVTIIAAVVFSGCSSSIDEIPSVDDGITLSVIMQSDNASRASEVVMPDGYTMECIMQLIDGSSNIVGSQKKAAVTNGKAIFTISADERASAKKALLWANYIDASGNSVYRTSDLCAIGYNSTTFDISTTDIRILDAFSGIVGDLSRDASITLTRPLINVLFTPTNTQDFEIAKSMKVVYTAPSVYNVSTKTSSATAEFTLNNPSFDAKKTPWLSTFIFAPSNMTTLGSDIRVSITDGINYSFTLPGDKVPMNENYQIIFGAELSSPNVTLTVTINPDFNGSQSQGPNTGTGEDPEPGKDPGTDPGTDPGQTTEFKVGAFVGADGSVVSSRDNAVGVVYHVGAIGDDKVSAYSGVAATSIKGYAVALENVSATHREFEEITGIMYSKSNGVDYNITIGNYDDFSKSYNAWKNAKALSGAKTSGWYVPTSEQLYEFLHMICADKDGTAATGDASFKALFPAGNIFDASQVEAVYSSCTWDLYNDENVQKVAVVSDKSSPKVQIVDNIANGKGVFKTMQLCRPIFTIFE